MYSSSQSVKLFVLILSIVFVPNIVSAEESNFLDNAVNQFEAKILEPSMKLINSSKAKATDEIEQMIEQQERRWTQRMWDAIKNKIKQGFRAFFQKQIEYLENRVLIPLKNLIQKGRGIVWQAVLKIKNYISSWR